MKNRITKEKLQRYRNLTGKALEIAEKSVIKGKEKEAEEILKMVRNYFSDSEYFEESKNLVSAFAALNYAHGWLDSGVRLEIFKTKDRNLFTIK
jgi:hypothetical protein